MGQFLHEGIHECLQLINTKSDGSNCLERIQTLPEGGPSLRKAGVIARCFCPAMSEKGCQMLDNPMSITFEAL